MKELRKVAIAIITTIILGIFVGPFLKRITKMTEPSTPAGIDPNEWEKIYNVKTTSKWLGVFERLIALIAFWKGAYIIIGGWLTFKVAAKWEVWKNIIQVPDSLDNVSQVSYLQSRNAWGTWLLYRFLIGTLINVLIGFIAAYIGQNIWTILDFLYETKQNIHSIFFRLVSLFKAQFI